jgi:hypothetical protein
VGAFGACKLLWVPSGLVISRGCLRSSSLEASFGGWKLLPGSFAWELRLEAGSRARPQSSPSELRLGAPAGCLRAAPQHTKTLKNACKTAVLGTMSGRTFEKCFGQNFVFILVLGGCAPNRCTKFSAKMPRNFSKVRFESTISRFSKTGPPNPNNRPYIYRGGRWPCGQSARPRLVARVRACWDSAVWRVPQVPLKQVRWQPPLGVSQRVSLWSLILSGYCCCLITHGFMCAAGGLCFNI